MRKISQAFSKFFAWVLKESETSAAWRELELEAHAFGGPSALLEHLRTMHALNLELYSRAMMAEQEAARLGAAPRIERKPLGLVRP